MSLWYLKRSHPPLRGAHLHYAHGLFPSKETVDVREREPVWLLECTWYLITSGMQAGEKEGSLQHSCPDAN